MEVPQFFELEPVPDPEQNQEEAPEDIFMFPNQEKEDEAPQVVPADSNKEQEKAPQFFNATTGPDPEQQPEDEDLVLLVGPDPEKQVKQNDVYRQDLKGLELEMEDEVIKEIREGSELEVECEEISKVLHDSLEPEVDGEQEVPLAMQGGITPDVEDQEENFKAFQSHANLEFNRIIDTDEVRQEYETHEARIQLIQHIQQNIPQEIVHLTDNISQGNEMHLNIVPMTNELLQPQSKETRSEILEQIMTLNTEEKIVRIVNNNVVDTTWPDITANQIIHRALLDHVASLFRMQFGASSLLMHVEANIPLLALKALVTLSLQGLPPVHPPLDSPPRFLALEGPPRLLALECPPSFLALEGPTPLLALEFPSRLLALEGPPRLLALEGPPRLLALEGPPRLLALEGPPRLLALEGPPRLLDLEDTPRLSVLECPSLLLALNVRLLLPALDARSLLPALDARPLLLALDAGPLLLALDAGPLLPALYARPLLPALDARPLLPVPDTRPLLPAQDARPLLPALDGLSLLQDRQDQPILQDLQDRPLLQDLQDRPLLQDLQDRPLLQDLQDRPLLLVPFPNETEISSELHKRSDLSVPVPSEFVPVCHYDSAAVQAESRQKTKKHTAKKCQQRTDLFADATLSVFEVLQDVEYENQDVSDPGVPEFSDPSELLKELNFGDMIPATLEITPAGDLEIEPIEEIETEVDGDLEKEVDGGLEIEADGDLRIEKVDIEIEEEGDLEIKDEGDLEIKEGNLEIKEGDLEIKEGDLEIEEEGDLEIEEEGDLEIEEEGDLEIEEEGDLEIEEEGDLEIEEEGDLEMEPFLPEFQRPIEEIIAIPEEPDENVPDAELPNNGAGNRRLYQNGRCRDREADLLERERQLDEEHPQEMKRFIIRLFLGLFFLLVFFILLAIALDEFIKYLKSSGNQTHFEPTPVTDMDFYVTTPMITTTFNATSLDYNEYISLSDLSTDMDI